LCILQMMADYGVDKYDIGTGFGHFGIAVEDVRLIFMYNSIAIGTDDVYKTAEAIKLHGGTIPVSTTKITACLDPNGWKTVCTTCI
ncbi:hypothetical protein BHE74_00055601, partial [Ensete ventricosum]